MGDAATSILTTPLHDYHLALGAKMVDFAGFAMPLHYPLGALKEHMAVRTEVGIFDVSHMGLIRLFGPDATALLERLSTNAIGTRPPGTAVYTVWANADGGALDDLLVYRLAEAAYFVVANASNRKRDLEHLQEQAHGMSVIVDPAYDSFGILAVQGPKATDLVSRHLPAAAELSPMQLGYAGSITIARTGYTGSDGFELFAPNDETVRLWELLVADGAVPAGLAARDSLRLEMAFALYGHELSPEIAPTESVAGWTVNWKKGDFLGRGRLEALEENPKKRSQYGVLLETGIPRRGCPVFGAGELLGTVTSGGFSPTLRKGIAIVMVTGQLQVGDRLEIEVRGKRLPATVVKTPFWRKDDAIH